MSEIFGSLPCVTNPTIGGHTRFLSSDLVAQSWPRIIGADDIVEILPSLVESGAESLKKFMFRKEQKYLSILVPHEVIRAQDRYSESKRGKDIRAGGTTMKAAPLWAPSGKNATTPEDYVKLSNTVKPEVVELLSDYDIDYRTTLSKKRFEKGLKRNEAWLEQQLVNPPNANLLIPILCHYDDKFHDMHISNVMKLVENEKSIIGYVLHGLDDRIEKEPFVLAERRISSLPKDAIICCFDFYTPSDIIKGFVIGVEVFGGQHAALLSEDNKAFNLPNAEFPERPMEILDFKDEKYIFRTDKISCESCVEYSLAYLYHLCKVNELLEPILLMRHNMDQMDRFLKHVRSFKDNKEKLGTLLNLVQ